MQKQKVECARCKGEKLISVPTVWKKEIMDYIYEREDCPVCQGTGKRMDHGNKYEPDDIFFKRVK